MDKKKRIIVVIGLVLIVFGGICAGLKFRRRAGSDAIERITAEGRGYIQELGEDQRGASEGVDRLKTIVRDLEAGAVMGIEGIDRSLGLAGQSAELLDELGAILGELERRSAAGAGPGR